jgi:hypothetical protein
VAEILKQDHLNNLESYGSDKDVSSKLEQIAFLKRLDAAYKSGRLIKTMIAHYVHYTMEDFLKMERIINDASIPDADKMKLAEKWPTR